MAKKKAAKPDLHRSQHMVRLPADVFAAMRALAEENDRPLTREIVRMLTAGLVAEGRWPKSNTST